MTYISSPNEAPRLIGLSRPTKDLALSLRGRTQRIHNLGIAWTTPKAMLDTAESIDELIMDAWTLKQSLIRESAWHSSPSGSLSDGSPSSAQSQSVSPSRGSSEQAAY
jgi:hypothetical protein